MEQADARDVSSTPCPAVIDEVVCQGDMEFDNLCLALKFGMKEEECVPANDRRDEDDSIPCPTVIDEVVCQGDMEFDKLCLAVKFGMKAEECEPVVSQR